MENIINNSTKCICKYCGCSMTGYHGDDECYECAYPLLAKASAAARKAVEESHFERTGERKTAGELLRNALGM